MKIKKKENEDKEYLYLEEEEIIIRKYLKIFLLILIFAKILFYKLIKEENF